MEARNVKHLIAALVTMFLCATLPVSAAMYKWTDADGSVNYSNQPPAEPDKVRGLTEMEITSRPAAGEPRTEAQRAAKENPSSDSAIGAGVTATLKPEPSAATTTPSPLRSEAATLAPDNDPAKRETTSPQRAPVRGLKEAARDPCLRSSDPSCYQRNKERYHPYLGYAPAVTQPGSTPPVGATSASGGVGAVGGQVAAPAAGATPRRIETPLVFFDQPPSKKRKSR